MLTSENFTFSSLAKVVRNCMNLTDVADYVTHVMLHFSFCIEWQ